MKAYRKMNRSLAFLLSWTLLFWLFPSVQAHALSGNEQVSHTYQESYENFMNPERGFMYIYSPGDSYYAADQARKKGYSLAYWNIKLNDFRDKPLSEKFLQQTEAQFQEVRKAGIKVVLRFVYDSTAKGMDAPSSIVLGHIGQLKPLLEKNSDVIAVLQAGFIGAWGEWHTSANNLTTPGNAGPILHALLDALPKERMIQLRTPMKKEELLPNGGIPLQPAEAFNGSDRARVGHHNDCFISSSTDVGTYPSKEIDRWKTYVAGDTRYTPHGGETCELSPYSASQNARQEMEKLHTSYLSIEYYQPVYTAWQREGAYDEIARRMGYRIVLDDASWTGQLYSGGSASITLNLRNAGFASMFNERPVYLVLDNGELRYNILLEDMDPRFWAPGERVHEETTFHIPDSVKPGVYKLALWLPDAAATLQDRSEYAVRLANEKMWDDAKGYNVLAEQITISEKPEEQPDLPPVAYGQSIVAASNTLYTGTLTADSASSAPLIYSMETDGALGHASITDPKTGTFTYMPLPGAAGQDRFTFRVFDGKLYSKPATVDITIEPPAAVNRPPAAMEMTLHTTAGQAIYSTFSAQDEDLDPLTFSIVKNGELGEAALLDPASGSFVYTPRTDASGTDYFSFRAFDGQEYSGTATVTVKIKAAEVPKSPPAAQNMEITAIEGKSVAGVLQADDPDDDPLTFQAVAKPKLGTVRIDKNTGSFTYAPSSGKTGTDSFTFRAYDGRYYSNLATVTVTIAPKPRPVPVDAAFTTKENQSFAGMLPVINNGGGSLTFSIASKGSLGSVKITDNGTGAFKYTPKSGRTGTDTFTFRVYDGSKYSAAAKVTITILSSPPPTADHLFLVTEENRAITGSLPGADPEGKALQYSIVSNGSLGTAKLTDPKKGQFSYTPRKGKSGLDQFTYYVYNGAKYSNKATVTIFVKEAYKAPIAKEERLTTKVNQKLAGTLKASVSSQGPVKFSIVSQPRLGSVKLTDEQTGAFTYTPKSGHYGTDRFSFQVHDGKHYSNVAAVTIDITGRRR